MLKRISGLILLWFILCSVDPGRIHLQGVIVDKSTVKPIDSAKISVSESTFLFTDSVGGFNFVQNTSGFEMFIEKKGYKPKYINFSNERFDRDKVIIKLQPSITEYKSCLTEEGLRFTNTLIKLIFSVFNAVTLIFILMKSKIRLKFLWILGIMLINPALRLLLADFSLLKFEIVNGPFYLFGYWNQPYSILIVIPLISMAFWVLYLLRRDWIQMKNQISERIPN